MCIRDRLSSIVISNWYKIEYPEFITLIRKVNIAQYKSKEDDKTLSLVESERVKEREERNAKRLKRANERLARQGLEPVKSLDDLPEDQPEIDPFLDEAANITYDLLGTGKYAIHAQ